MTAVHLITQIYVTGRVGIRYKCLSGRWQFQICLELTHLILGNFFHEKEPLVSSFHRFYYLPFCQSLHDIAFFP
ncbi:hypothetical protein Cabther_B0041 [Chloracidobacterium thermophilum B]|uniref:Uncharacterized protein n=1 Tax=Chloracidobacterium thermophilum (strain B) TaxID=981222 RepID=G2LJN2_CHLTF|nr:hypothetical protein Cabther_B0041 [Chloracidobacterium thermophilum B]